MLPKAYESDEYKSLKTAVEILVIVANSLFFLFALITVVAFYKYFRMNSKSKQITGFNNNNRQQEDINMTDIRQASNRNNYN